jgi:hypothetical protein
LPRYEDRPASAMAAEIAKLYNEGGVSLPRRHRRRQR